jgi:Breast carcinoma amplified sequence 2 (BCAS2)
MYCSLQKNPLLAAEIERVESHVRLSAIDTKRFQLPPPSSTEPTVQDWEAALKNARAQLEHQRLR